MWEAVSAGKIKKRSDGIKRECEVRERERESEREGEKNQDGAEPRYIHL